MASHVPALGLAGAEKRLYQLNMNQGEMSVQRQVMQFRVDYLSDLNTQSTLLAGVAVGMLGSLELEAMQPEEEELQTFGRMLLVAGYVLAACTSLGASVWVLYTSNNLVNSALVAQLYGSTLEDMQNAESVLALRMLDVRKMYILALLTMLPAQLIMVGTLINYTIAIPASFVVAWFLAHAIHADFATAWHLEHYNIPLNEMRPEYWVEGVAQRFFSRDAKSRDVAGASTTPNTPVADFLERRLRSLFGSTSYERLGERVDVAKNQKRTARFERSVSSIEWPEKDCAECSAEDAELELQQLRHKPGRITFAHPQPASEADSVDGTHSARSHDHHHHSATLIQKHWLARLVPALHHHSHSAGQQHAAGHATGDRRHSGETSRRNRSPAARHFTPMASAPPTSNLATGETYGTMCKTPSEKGPSELIHSVAIGPLGRLEMLRTTPAATPGHARWWVVKDGRLSCYKAEAEWRESQPPKLFIDLKEYACIRSWDPNGLLCIALLPWRVLFPPTGAQKPARSYPAGDSPDRSWYLCAHPASISHSRMTEQWLALLDKTCATEQRLEQQQHRRG